VLKLEEWILKARKLAETKIAKGKSADESVEIAETDGFRIYAVAGKTLKEPSSNSFHENPRDVFMLILEGEVEFTFENGRKTTVKSAECFVLPKHLMHRCIFKKMTVGIEGVYEKGL
jgi:quercetin dioxygenase-like cupin family protein